MSLSADAEAASKFKEVCETERLKSDLADVNDKIAHHNVAISDLKNYLHAIFNRIYLFEGVTTRKAQELGEVRAAQIDHVNWEMHNILLYGIPEMRN